MISWKSRLDLDLVEVDERELVLRIVSFWLGFRRDEFPGKVTHMAWRYF